MRHIVDELIEERAERLRSSRLLWPLVRRLFYPVLGYRTAIATVDHTAQMSGREVFDYLSQRLSMDVRVRGIEHLPRTGLAIVTPNHPAGIADGIAVWDAIREVRDDVIFFANRDAVRANPRLTEMIIPVEWDTDKRNHARNKETVRAMARAFRDEKLIVLFPSGRLAQPTWRGLREREWLPTAVGLAQKYGCPLLPLHINGRNSWIYYLCYLVHNELRDMTLFRELLNKEGSRYELTFGHPYMARGDATIETQALRAFVTGPLAAGQLQHPGIAALTPGMTPTAPLTDV